jgi:uncharacterized protein (DUF2141 family)
MSQSVSSGEGIKVFVLLFFQEKKHALGRCAAGLLFLKKKKQKDFCVWRSSALRARRSGPVPRQGARLRSFLSSFTLVALLCLGAPGRAAEVIVSVHGVRNALGDVRVAICSRADFLRPHCLWSARAPAANGTVDVHFPDVPVGTYATEAFHDENRNGVIDRNFLGLPKEGIGFSNDAPMHFGPPKFDAAAFAVSAPLTRITLTLRYF